MSEKTLYEKLDRAQNALCMLETTCRAIGTAGIAEPKIGETWFEGVADTVQGVLDTVNDVFERYGDELEAEAMEDNTEPFVPPPATPEFKEMLRKGREYMEEAGDTPPRGVIE